VRAHERWDLRLDRGGPESADVARVIGNSAYVITLTGESWKIDGISDPACGVSR
jgi:hypothetical protein